MPEPGAGKPRESMPPTASDFWRSWSWYRDPAGSLFTQPEGSKTFYKLPNMQAFMGTGIPWEWIQEIPEVPVEQKLWENLVQDVPGYDTAWNEWMAQQSYQNPDMPGYQGQYPDPSTWGDTRTSFDFFLSDSGDAFARDARDGDWYSFGDPQDFMALGVPVDWVHGVSDEFVDRYSLGSKPSVEGNMEELGLTAYGGGYGAGYSWEQYVAQAETSAPPWENDPGWLEKTEESPFGDLATSTQNLDWQSLFMAQAEGEWPYSAPGGEGAPDMLGQGAPTPPGTYDPPDWSGQYPPDAPPGPWTATPPGLAYADPYSPDIPSFEGVEEADLLAYIEEINALLPYYQSQRAAGQWAQEFQESARRYTSEMDMRAALESWNQQMAGAEF